MTPIEELEGLLAEDNPFWKVGEGYEDFILASVEEGDSGRWSVWFEYVVQHTPTGKYFAFDVERALTELQEVDQDDFDVREVTRKVEMVEKVTWVKA